MPATRNALTIIPAATAAARPARLLAGAGLLALALAAAPVLTVHNAHAQTDIGALSNPGGVTIEGTVSEVFGNKFVLEDDSGRILVETGPAWRNQIELSRGERLSVTGEPRDGSFEASSLEREDGEVVTLERGGQPRGSGAEAAARTDGPLGREEVLAMLREQGYGRFDDLELKGRHIEVEAYDETGREWELKISYDGVIYERELEDHDRPDRDEARAPGVPQAREMLEAAGYGEPRQLETKGRHVEAIARSPRGDEVEVHMDFAGVVYKEKAADYNDDLRPHRDRAWQQAGRDITQDQIAEHFSAAGYTEVRGISRKPRHVEAIAQNPYGEEVEVHMDLDGTVYRERSLNPLPQ